MKSYCIIILVALLATTGMATAQRTTEVRDINGQPWHLDNIGPKVNGTPMLSDYWGTGSVKCVDNKGLDSIQMNIDLEYNRVLFVKDGLTYGFSDQVLECRYTYTEEGKTKETIFRSNYPEAGSHRPATLYEVLGQGPRYQLLRYSSKKTLERREFNGPLTLYYQLSSELFIYDSTTQTMHKIKPKKSSVTDALPDQKAAIEKICIEKGLELRTTEEIAMLVKHLK